MRRSGLGRGLGALIPNEVVGDKSSPPCEIPVVAIGPTPPAQNLLRRGGDGFAHGVDPRDRSTPAHTRPGGRRERYELIAGERRWRAAKRAGLPTIPAIVRESSDLHSLEQALVENLHRLDLNPLEEASAYQQLIEDFGLTHEQLSIRVGKSRVAITNMLRLFQLPTVGAEAGQRRATQRRARPGPAGHPGSGLPGVAGPQGHIRATVGAGRRGSCPIP